MSTEKLQDVVNALISSNEEEAKKSFHDYLSGKVKEFVSNQTETFLPPHLKSADVDTSNSK